MAGSNSPSAGKALEANLPRDGACAAAVVGLALRFALSAAPFGLRRASLQGKTNELHQHKPKLKKGTFLMR